MIKAERSFPAAYSLDSVSRISVPFQDHPSAMQKSPALLDVKKLTLLLSQLKYLYNIIDEFVKSQNPPLFVIPANAGIQEYQMFLDPAFAGVTGLGTFYETVIIE